jgi:AraC-like DNA-binding protein
MHSVRQLTYQPVSSGAPVEVMRFDRLRELNRGGTQRADFHVFAVVEDGRGSVDVDFEEHRLARRTVVWVPPGAVHRWEEIATLDGRLVLFIPGAPFTRTPMPDRGGAGIVPETEWSRVIGALDHLESESTAEARIPLVPELLLTALIERLRSTLSALRRRPSSPFEAFRTRVEQQFRSHHDAAYYARGLGYSPRTLSRLVGNATGRTAKRYIADRVVLEAKRLLAHDRHNSVSVAAELGFSDPTNFSSFFRNATGMPPGAWQRLHFVPE